MTYLLRTTCLPQTDRVLTGLSPAFCQLIQSVDGLKPQISCVAVLYLLLFCFLGNKKKLEKMVVILIV